MNYNDFEQLETRRQKAIPWDAWARERSIEMNCEVNCTINQLDRPQKSLNKELKKLSLCL